jgi:hypothetical protein
MRALIVVMFLFSAEAFAQRPEAKLDCKFTGKEFVYDCAIQIKRDAQPVSGLNVLVSADMPSMPMAHNVKPVKAKPGKAPGEYQARLDLEMTGEWAVKLRLAGPLRDQLVLHYEFDERGARPVRRSGKSPRK